MIGTELLAAAVAAEREFGIKTLKDRVRHAEDHLQTARGAVAKAIDAESALLTQQAAVASQLAHYNRDAAAVYPAIMKNILTVFGDQKLAIIPVDLSAAIEKRDAEVRTAKLLDEALRYSTEYELPVVQLHRAAAELAVAEASRDWTICAAHADLAELNHKLTALLSHDQNLSVDSGPCSKASVYAASITSAELLAWNLRDDLQRKKLIVDALSTGN